MIAVAALLLLWLISNYVYQVIRKPSELFFPVSGTLYKTPSETWRQYAPLFRKHSTEVMTPDLLAAIAQVEGSGNPVAHTYWRWSWKSQPFEVYRPASSAVGMYQITDGTFAEARRYCIHRHVVVEDGPWNDWQSCWFNRLYARVIPAHAVELTSAYLDRSVASILERHRITAATLQHKQELATLIHLCGAGAGDEYARRGFHLLDGQRCGDHEARVYLARVSAMKAIFDGLAARGAAAAP
jgi:Transglycosylase SLT domain